MTNKKDIVTAFTPQRYLGIFSAKYLNDIFLLQKENELKAKMNCEKYYFVSSDSKETIDFDLQDKYFTEFIKNVYENSFILADNLFNIFVSISYSTITFSLNIIKSKTKGNLRRVIDNSMTNDFVCLEPKNYEYSRKEDCSLIDEYTNGFQYNYVNLIALDDALKHLDLSYDLIAFNPVTNVSENLNEISNLDKYFFAGYELYIKIYPNFKVRFRK